MPLALKSYDIWEELEELPQQKILHKVGGLVLGSPEDEFLNTTIKAAQKYDIKHEMLDQKQIQRKFPEFNANKNIIGYY